jgi:hypothetical protein|tara:strand:- start:3365 stop:3664 length:300 start_codon:yes stop_codon:yes gene_type:complete
MLAVHTPAPFEPKKPIRNETVEELAENHCYEVVRWGAYLTDRACLEQLRQNKDPNVILYIALMRGITPIMTIGQFKSFIVSFAEIKDKKQTRKIPSYKV